MTQTRDNRIPFIDIAKGITMLTIFWGHVMLSGKLNTIVYAFHIPVYFFLAGTVYRGKKYPSALALVKRRWTTLLLPYGFYSLVTWLFWLIDCASKGISLEGCWQPLLQTILAQGSAGYMRHNPALWFVPCLFVVELFYYYIHHLKPLNRIILCLLFAGIGCVMMRFEYLKALPWSIEVSFTAVIFYAIGNFVIDWLRHTEFLATVKKYPLRLLCIIVGSFILLCIGGLNNGRVSMAQGYLGNHALVFYLVSLCGIVFILSLSIALESLCGHYKLLDRIINRIRWMGQNSFYLMVLHIPVMLVCVRIIAWISGQSLEAVRYAYRYTIPAWIGMIAVTYFLTASIQYLKFRHTASKK